MHGRSVRQILEGLPELRDLTRGARRLLRLQQMLDAKLPATFRGQVAVAGISAGTLQILAANGAVAAKLRQVLRRLTAQLRQLEPEVNAIHVRVQVRNSINPLLQKQIFLSSEAAKAVSALARRVPPSPLRSALERLAARPVVPSDD